MARFDWQAMHDGFENSPRANQAALLFIAGIPFVIYMVAQLIIAYTYGHVVPTLAAIETPRAPQPRQPRKTPSYADEELDDPVPPYRETAEDQKQPLLVERVEQVTDSDESCGPAKPLTSSLRDTAKHLRAHGGRGATVRGWGIGLLWFLKTSWLSHVIGQTLLGLGPLWQAGLFVVFNVLAMRLNLLWTHRVISMPSSKPWYRRFVSRKTARKIFLPTLAWSVAQLSLHVLPVVLGSILVTYRQDYDRIMADGGDREAARSLAIHLLGTLAVFGAMSLAVVVLVWFPIHASFLRCQAALLPEDETPIVEFDRTFGGLVVPQSEGGSGALRMKDAWRSFDKPARRNMFKAYIKSLLLQGLAFVVFVFSVSAMAVVAGMLL